MVLRQASNYIVSIPNWLEFINILKNLTLTLVGRRSQEQKIICLNSLTVGKEPSHVYEGNPMNHPMLQRFGRAPWYYMRFDLIDPWTPHSGFQFVIPHFCLSVSSGRSGRLWRTCRTCHPNAKFRNKPSRWESYVQPYSFWWYILRRLAVVTSLASAIRPRWEEWEAWIKVQYFVSSGIL